MPRNPFIISGIRIKFFEILQKKQTEIYAMFFTILGNFFANRNFIAT